MSQTKEEMMKCPECGAPAKMHWSGLELVENTGDETLASKHFTYQPESRDREIEELREEVDKWRSDQNRLQKENSELKAAKQELIGGLRIYMNADLSNREMQTSILNKEQLITIREILKKYQ